MANQHERTSTAIQATWGGKRCGSSKTQKIAKWPKKMEGPETLAVLAMLAMLLLPNAQPKG
jgi:hypothetical protein